MNQVMIIGALNVTPDSFHDGGRFTSIEAAMERATQMLADGADIIEVGGESTGPKSPDVSLDEELKRVIPVITAIRKKHPAVRISVDTWKAAVAQEAINAGAGMINDVTAGRSDPGMFTVVAKSSAQLVLMYAKDPTPRTTIEDRQYDDVIGTISDFLRKRKDAAVKADISSDRIILDPGLGHFVSSDAQYSFEIIRRLREFGSLGSPVFLSPSRKSFLAGSQNLPTAERLPATVAASAIAVLNGAMYIRTHDVREVRIACDVAWKIPNPNF